jgi:hypothetical protein
LLETLRDANECFGERLLSDVVEEPKVIVQDRQRRRQILEQRVDVPRVTLQSPPVANFILPPRAEENGRDYLASPRVLIIDPCKPGSLSYPVRKLLPERPELWGIRLAICNADHPNQKPMNFVWVTIDSINNGFDNPYGVPSRGTEQEVFKQIGQS